MHSSSQLPLILFVLSVCRRRRDQGGARHDRGAAKAFQAGDGELAYSYAAPNVKRIFPTVETFMGMVESGYQPVRKPQ